MVMFMVSLLQWWYFRGWGVFANGLKQKLRDSADFFSISQLLRTLFKPFRQISANTSEEMAGSKMAAFFDRLVSRIVGFFTRTFIIIFGSIAIILEASLGVIFIVLWPVAPLIIIVGISMTIMGVTL